MRGERGSVIITAPIITIAMFFIICIAIVIAIEVIKPFIVYEKISSIALKYIFIMEEYGYLNEYEKNNLLKELHDKGIDITKVTITGNIEKQEYAEPINLRIKYDYSSDLYKIIDVFDMKKEEIKMPIIIEKKSFCKI